MECRWEECTIRYYMKIHETNSNKYWAKYLNLGIKKTKNQTKLQVRVVSFRSPVIIMFSFV